MGNGANPYTLFLILILLILGFDQDAGQKMEVMRNVMDKVANTLNNFKTGVNTMAADFQDIHVMMRGL